ncbi:glycosyltransferase family protein [Effusibacillus pohliae]|uniref:glycosyltransferase n=1 Tax=Effusibacillus pohliae TaxID=232270 RepID=UPI00036F0341|nr:glycosyltransferase [Effusibacillus pohliae]
MERILMISYFAPPILSAESILVGKLLPELSRHFQIELVAAGDDVDFRKDETLAERTAAENVEIHRYHNPKPANKIVRRLYQKGASLFNDVNDKWMKQVLLRHKPKGPYKLIYSRSMPGVSHLAAHAFKQKLGVPWVAQFNDPWAHNPYHQYPLARMHQVEERNEAKVIHAADKLIFPTVEIRDLVASYYPGVDVKGKSVIMPHYYVEQLYGQAEGTPSQANGEDSRLTVSYIGDFYGLRSPEPLLQALQIVGEKAPEVAGRIHLRLIGNVDWRLQPLFDKFGPQLSTTIERVGQVPYLKSLAEMKNSDILLLIDAPSDVNLFLPSKLIDYFGARKPILGITAEKGTTGALIRSYGFPVADPREPERIAAELIGMVENLNRYRRLADENDTEMFTARSVADELARLFHQL